MALSDNSAPAGTWVGPRQRILLTENRTVPSSMRPAEAELRISEEGELSWTVVVPEQRFDTETQAHGRIIETGKILLHRLQITRHGIAGRKGNVLRPGRLVGLMEHVRHPKEMDSLCRAVFIRYASVKGWGLNPSHANRNQVYRVIQRAWKQAKTADWLCHVSAEFWSGALPGERIAFFRTTEKVSLSFVGEKRYVSLWAPLDQLLDPDQAT